MDLDQAVKIASGYFSNAIVIMAICFGLILLAFGVAIYSEIKTRQIARDAKYAIAQLEAGGEGITLQASQAKASSPLIDYLKVEMRDLQRLSGTQYRLRQSTGSEELDEIIPLYTDTRFLDALPNVFVGIGLFLTFVGLSLSLWDASRGAASGDPTIVKQSVTTLLKFSAVKFTTSLVALLCSISLGLTIRVQRRRAETALRKVDRKLEEVFPLLTVERIVMHQVSTEYREQEYRHLSSAVVTAIAQNPEMQLSRQHIEELLEQAKEQSAHLQSFNSNLAIQLGEALDNKLQPIIQQLADRMETALREMGGSIGSSNESALKSLLESFIEELRGATKDESASLQRNLAELASNLGTASSELSERMSSVFTSVESTGERFASIIADASASFNREMGQVQSDMGAGLTEALTAIKSSAEQSARQSESLLEQLSAGAVSFRSSVEGGASAFVGELDRGAKSIDTVVGRLGSTVDHLGTLVEKASAFGEVSGRVAGERIAQLQSTLKDVDTGFQRVSEATTPFSRAAEQVRTAIELLRTTETSVQGRMSEFTRAAAIMTETSSKLSETVEDQVTRLSEGLGGSSDRLVSSIATIANQSEKAGKTLAETIGSTLAEYEKRFAGIDRDLQLAMKTITEEFTRTYEQIRERVSTVDSIMADSVNRLASHNDTFLGHTEDLSDAVEQLSLAMSKSK